MLIIRKMTLFVNEGANSLWSHLLSSFNIIEIIKYYIFEEKYCLVLLSHASFAFHVSQK